MRKVSKDKTNKEIRHDLKSPLAVISGYAQLIMKKYEGKDSKEEKWSTEIFHQVERLVEMINELLKDESEIKE